MSSNTKSFSPSEAIKFGWNTVKKRLFFFVGLYIVSILISFIPNLITEPIKEQVLLVFLVSIASWFIQVAVSLGFLQVMLQAVDGKNPKFDDLFSKFDFILIIKYFAASILVGFAVLGGLILLIIPGIYIAYRVSFFSYVLVENKKSGPIQAIKESWRMTKGNVWNLIVLGIYSFGVIILGVLALFVGVFVSIAVISVATAYAYRKLSSFAPKS